MFSSRERFAGVAEVTYHLTKTRKGAIVYAAPTGKIVKETIPKPIVIPKGSDEDAD
jgi:hypothetical protein